jgi:outer membrane protein assembly factor BamE (lipoprotein component of BamABCDE complex)
MNQTLNNKIFNNTNFNSKGIKRLILALPLAFALTGCVVVVGNDDHDGEFDWNNSNSSSEWKQVQNSNKAKIAALEVGSSLADVKTAMGTPNINEAFTENNQQYQVLFYRTRHKHSDGETTKDECTTLIFVDGTLKSWGQKAYSKL